MMRARWREVAVLQQELSIRSSSDQGLHKPVGPEAHRDAEAFLGYRPFDWNQERWIGDNFGKWAQPLWDATIHAAVACRLSRVNRYCRRTCDHEVTTVSRHHGRSDGGLERLRQPAAQRSGLDRHE